MRAYVKREPEVAYDDVRLPCLYRAQVVRDITNEGRLAVRRHAMLQCGEELRRVYGLDSFSGHRLAHEPALGCWSRSNTNFMSELAQYP